MIYQLIQLPSINDQIFHFYYNYFFKNQFSKEQPRFVQIGENIIGMENNSLIRMKNIIGSQKEKLESTFKNDRSKRMVKS